MANDINSLFAIAEIAGVFIGFAALVTVVARGRADGPRLEDSFSLANVVIINVRIGATGSVLAHRPSMASSDREASGPERGRRGAARTPECPNDDDLHPCSQSRGSFGAKSCGFRAHKRRKRRWRIGGRNRRVPAGAERC